MVETMLLPLQLASGDAIGWIVALVIFAIVQALGAARQKTPGGKPSRPPADSGEPQDELRNFLDALARQARGETDDEEEEEVGPAAARPAAPPPPPRPQPVAPPPVAARPPPVAARPPPVPPAAPVAATPRPTRAPIRIARTEAAARKRRRRSTAAELRQAVRRHDSLRTAVVYREVLGPPIALRTSDELQH